MMGEPGAPDQRASGPERERRGQILDDYLADYERRKGSIAGQEQDRARQIFDEVLAEGRSGRTPNHPS